MGLASYEQRKSDLAHEVALDIVSPVQRIHSVELPPVSGYVQKAVQNGGRLRVKSVREPLPQQGSLSKIQIFLVSGFFVR